MKHLREIIAHRLQRHSSPAVVALSCLVALAFYRVLNNGFIIYDDQEYVTGNSIVKEGLSLHGLHWALVSSRAANWHPLTWLSHMLDCQLYGLHPWGHHLTSLLLHAANTVLVYWLFTSATRAPGRSFIVAALFGLHPLRVQSVAWVAERKDVLSAFFWLLTMLAYFKYATPLPGQPSAPNTTDRNRPARWLYYSLALGAFILAVLSKPMVVTLPFVLLLMDYWPLARIDRSNVAERGIEKVPFLLLAAGSCVVTFLIQNTQGAVLRGASLELRLENALVAYCRYLGKIFWPTHLSIFYPFPDRPWPLGEVALAGAALAGISLVVVLLGRRRPYAAIGWFWFLGTLVPVIGIVQVGVQSIADRYTYLPSIGIFVILVWGLGDLLAEWKWRIPLTIGAVTAAIVFCVADTSRETGYWKDGETLFARALAVTTPNVIALDSLGEELVAKHRNAEARPLFEKGIALAPDYADVWLDLGGVLLAQGDSDGAIAALQSGIHASPNYAGAHRDLGAAYLAAGRRGDAITELREAARLDPNDPGAHRWLGMALGGQKQLAEAIAEYRTGLRLEPGDSAEHLALGGLLAQAGRSPDAAFEVQMALKLDPTNAEAHNLLGQIYTREGSMELAKNEFQAAVHFNPGLAQAHYFLGGALAEAHQLDDAIKEFQAALKIQPDYADAENDLGMALAANGRQTEAIASFQAAIRLQPDNPDTHNNLGISLCNAGQTNDAIAQFREALRLNPDLAAVRKNLEAVLAASGTTGN